MKYSIYILALAAILVLNACSHSRHPDSMFYDPNDPGYEYAPAMYHSYPYEPLTQVTDQDEMAWKYNSSPVTGYADESINQNVLKPVTGTIARGKLDVYFPYENSDSGRIKAGIQLENPIVLDDFHLNEGRRLYNLYCDHCHGETGNGQGSLVEGGKIPTMGAYYDKLKDRPAGSIYHTITYGKGIMGAHSSQLSPKQRWLITHWVQCMQQSEEAHTVRDMAGYQALFTAPASDSTSTVESDSTATPELDSNAVDTSAVQPIETN